MNMEEKENGNSSIYRYFSSNNNNWYSWNDMDMEPGCISNHINQTQRTIKYLRSKQITESKRRLKRDLIPPLFC